MRLALLLLCCAPSWAVCTPKSGYTYCKELVVDAVGSTLTDFPVLWTGDAQLKTTGNGGRLTDAQGDDVDFTSDEAGTATISCQRVSWSATTGLGQYWIKRTLGTGAVNIYVSYGNAAVTTNQCADTDVFNAAYMGVYHLEEDPTTTCSGANEACDSTANARNLNENGVLDSTTGKIGNGFLWNADDEFLSTGLAASTFVTASAGTGCAWINPTGAAPTPGTVYQGQAVFGEGGGYMGLYRANVTLDRIWAYNYSGGEVQSGAAYSASTWQHACWVHSGGNIIIYLNGAATSNASGDTDNLTNTLLVGDGYGPGDSWVGSLDEVHFSNVARSADWIAAEYNNQNDPTAFIANGTEQGGGGGTPTPPRRRGVSF